MKARPLGYGTSPRLTPAAYSKRNHGCRSLPEQLGRACATDIIKMVAYQTESDLLALLRPHYARVDQERRTLLHELFATAGDIRVSNSELNITLAPLSSPHRTLAARMQEKEVAAGVVIVAGPTGAMACMSVSLGGRSMVVSLVRGFLLLPIDLGDADFVRAPRRLYPADLRMIPGAKVAVPAARRDLLDVSEADNHAQGCSGKPYSSQKS